MTATAPLPANFPPPVDADLLLGAPIAAAEAVAEPVPRLLDEPIRRVLPGGGHLDASPRALAIMAADIARIRAMPPVLHASEVEGQRREREEQAEAARRAAPDPAKVLASAHQLHAEAQAEIGRLAPLVERARDLVRGLEGRVQEQSATVTIGEAAATEKLIAALRADEESLPLSPRLDAAAAQLEATSIKLRTARAALAQLEAEDKAARDLLTRRQHGVSRCALAVMVADAADMANEIVGEAEELDRRRADLDALARLLTAESRRLNGAALPSLPAQISRALYAPDRVLHGTDRGMAQTDWPGRYRALCEDLGGLLSDTAEEEPQQPTP